MKIYFAGAIRGGREDAELYAKVIEILKKYGTVLTEHLGDTSITSAGQMAQGKSAEDIFGDDTGWLDESDIVIAEVTTPSLGVGYELGRAEAKGKRVICLFREGGDKKLSAMILGNKKFITIQYSDMTELPDIFNLYLN